MSTNVPLGTLLFHTADGDLKAIVGHKQQQCDAKELSFVPIPLSDLLETEVFFFLKTTQFKT